MRRHPTGRRWGVSPAGPRIAVVGSLNIDYYSVVERLPVGGETVCAAQSLRRFGGKGANQAVAASRLGASVALVGCVGDDGRGRDYIAALEREGIDCGGVYRDGDASTGSAFITVDSAGENTIVVAPGANAKLGERRVSEQRDAIATADLLLIQNEVPAAANFAAARVARESDTVVIYNPAPWRGVPAEGWPPADVWVVNEVESGALAKVLAPARRLTTRGAAPTSVVWDGESFEVAAERVEVVDTVGAGDTFIGAVATRLAAGETPRAAVGFANRAAALAVAAFGAQEAMPTLDRMGEAGGRSEN